MKRKLLVYRSKIKSRSRMQLVGKLQTQQVRICDLLSKSMVSTGDVGAKLHRIGGTWRVRVCTLTQCSDPSETNCLPFYRITRNCKLSSENNGSRLGFKMGRSIWKMIILFRIGCPLMTLATVQMTWNERKEEAELSVKDVTIFHLTQRIGLYWGNHVNCWQSDLELETPVNWATLRLLPNSSIGTTTT